MTTFIELTTKKDRIAYIKEHLATNERWAQRGMLRIYSYQTAEEQATDNTRDNNSVGFNGVDSFILSQYCKRLLDGKNLTGPMMAIVFKKMPKYASQLEAISAKSE